MTQPVTAVVYDARMEVVMSAANALRNVEGPFRITWLKQGNAGNPSSHAHLRLVPEPRPDKYEELAKRRRRAQIAARHALELE